MADEMSEMPDDDYFAQIRGVAASVEVANNPAVDESIRQLAEQNVNRVADAVKQQGQPGQ